ncbi:MAG TPA: sugar phosphate isomerase/epimerase, partial [Gordonia sp. (in: high G+C Gram-positive bacteria)]|nr:sugar phosphate isomerase/epimerase [Gordonia sp. (in: high G+C Gram-positive bacteria)]
ALVTLVHHAYTDGSGAAHDEHLLPGDGTQPCATICRRLAESDFDGAVVLEITTSSARTKPERGAMLARALDFARTHLARHGAST